jgi:hypothetical protein
VARLGAGCTTFAPHFLAFFGGRVTDTLFFRVRVIRPDQATGKWLPLGETAWKRLCGSGRFDVLVLKGPLELLGKRWTGTPTEEKRRGPGPLRHGGEMTRPAQGAGWRGG